MAVGNKVADKAESFKDEAAGLGWTTSLTRNGDRVTVVVKRNNEEISITWKGNACLNEVYYTLNGHQRKLRNAAAARRHISTGSNEATVRKPVKTNGSSPKKIKKAKPSPEPAPEPFKSTPKPPKLIPFDFDTATDEEILKAVIGKRIVWRNSLSGNYEEARVLNRPNQRQLRIERNGRNERCITFASADLQDPRSAGGGFRSIKLSAIRSITTK
jgi:hypothetical protein